MEHPERSEVGAPLSDRASLVELDEEKVRRHLALQQV